MFISTIPKATTLRSQKLNSILRQIDCRKEIIVNCWVLKFWWEVNRFKKELGLTHFKTRQSKKGMGTGQVFLGTGQPGPDFWVTWSVLRISKIRVKPGPVPIPGQKCHFLLSIIEGPDFWIQECISSWSIVKFQSLFVYNRLRSRPCRYSLLLP